MPDYYNGVHILTVDIAPNNLDHMCKKKHTQCFTLASVTRVKYITQYEYPTVR